MISRGYYLGEIIDSLSNVSQQVETRCALGLTDLNKYLEDFFLYILNEALELQLVNFNEERCNAPGIDLFDEVNSIGFQITSTKTTKKINDTLEAISKLDNPPDTIYVFIIGKLQSSYTLDKSLCEKSNFSEKNIWDTNTLCKKLIDLSIDKLQTIYEYVRKELARVKIELEIPNENGEYSTTIKNYIEQMPKPTLTDFSIYYKYHSSQHDSFELSLEKVQEDFSVFSKELSKLPRITREFYAFLLERRDEDKSSDNYFRFNHNRLKRICHFSNLDEEITLLSEHGFVDLSEPDNYNDSPYVRVFGKGMSYYFVLEFVDFTESNGIGFIKPIVNLDFSKYGI